MDSPTSTTEISLSPVNWEALDSLIISFAKSENLLEDDTPPSPSPSSSPSSSQSSNSYQSRILIRQIRRLIESGDIDTCINLLKLHSPSVLDDHRLLFCLQKQKFIELLRRGTAEDRSAAVECLRNSLAPTALDAYPEAYEEFKHILLALIYDKDDATSPVANEWSERRRFDIAGMMSSILRAHLHAHDPVFCMALRYLISIHKEFCLRQGVSSPITDLTERLLLEEKDPPATPQESLLEVPPFDEVDIQALAHAVQLTRQGAVDSLRVAKGDLFQAFQNEICRMRLNESLLDELVHEYCIYRGIVDPVTASSARSGLQKPNRVDGGCCSSGNCTPDVENGNSKNSDGESSITNAHFDGSEISTDMIKTKDVDVEMRFPTENSSNLDDCSTSGTHQSKSLRNSLRNRRQGVVDDRKRKRWRGRNNDLDVCTGMYIDQSSKTEGSGKLNSLSLYCDKEDNLEKVLGIKELADNGMAAEVFEEVNALDIDLFAENPVLLFQLKQVEFLKLIESGDHPGALRVACSHLGPLAASDPSLLKPLKETLLAFLSPKEVALKELPLGSLASSLQVVIGGRLEIGEPQLVKVVQAILHTHKEWFKLQMCKDRFESFLKIDTLREVRSMLLADAVTKSSLDVNALGSSQATISSGSRTEDGDSPTQTSSSEICDEGAILKVMEFLALPRADAIHLLAQYEGSAETAIQQLLA